jgi:hypothetical protein
MANRLKRQMVDGVTGDVVESDEQVKGYAVGKDQNGGFIRHSSRGRANGGAHSDCWN